MAQEDPNIQAASAFDRDVNRAIGIGQTCPQGSCGDVADAKSLVHFLFGTGCLCFQIRKDVVCKED